MLKKFIVGSALAAAALVMAAPAASAAPYIPKGTYPNEAQAIIACDNGIANGWWDACGYRIANPQTGTVQLYTNR